MSADAELRIVRGDPTPEELAALTALVSAAAASSSDQSETDQSETEPPRRGRWNDPAAAHRGSWRSGPGGWRAAGQ